MLYEISAKTRTAVLMFVIAILFVVGWGVHNLSRQLAAEIQQSNERISGAMTDGN